MDGCVAPESRGGSKGFRIQIAYPRRESGMIIFVEQSRFMILPPCCQGEAICQVLCCQDSNTVDTWGDHLQTSEVTFVQAFSIPNAMDCDARLVPRLHTFLPCDPEPLSYEYGCVSLKSS